MKKIIYFFLLMGCTFLQAVTTLAQKRPIPQAYQLRIYQYENDTQETSLDAWLQKELLPALHKKSIRHIGVFKPLANDTARIRKTIVLIPYRDLKEYAAMAPGLPFDTTAYPSAPYTRVENILLEAFRLAPKLTLPQLSGDRAERVYELRSYESASEKAFRNKVEMFNEGGEIELFARLQFNAVFYASVIAGSRMPNLMYMTSFDNLAEREAHWKSFGGDPEWKKLSAMLYYQNNVSSIEITLLRAQPYSDY